MITKMTKYSFILLSGESEAFLENLQELGVVDIQRSTKPVDQVSSAMLEKTLGMRKAIAFLEKLNYAEEGIKASAVNCYSGPVDAPVSYTHLRAHET